VLIPALLTALQVAQGPVGQVYHGRNGELSVAIPRIEAKATIDGVLNEDAWRQAAVLTGFSQYMPVDGVAATDSTEVLAWYAPDGIWFGIRAFEPHGSVNATLADRDKIDTDDFVQILLDTFNDRRRALVFGVNPLGVQADGIRSEGSMGTAGGRSANGRFENVDMNPDFVYASKGRVTEYGYEVEMFIPFKSLRYQSTEPQTWAINVIRKVQHSGYEDSWVPARRANASFLTQSGTLERLEGLQRGLVLDLNPFATGRLDGSPQTDGTWSYDATPEIGANVRWGVTTNLTLDGTINPDFSQVEADVGVITVNERFAVFYPEKRPFFLEGLEQFDTPNQLIYMRRIAEPVGGAKLTGKVGALNVGLLSSLDAQGYSSSGEDNPFFNLLRLRHDLGANSTVGVSYTDKIDGGNYNRVASADAHLVFAKLYFIEAQVAGAFTRTDSVNRFGPLWEITADRTGRNWGFHYTLKGIHPDFETQSGFVNRTGIVAPNITNRITTYGKPGALLENYTAFIMMEGVWDYDTFLDVVAPLETSIRGWNRFTLRGGWSPSVTPTWKTAAFDPEFYGDYYVESTSAGLTDTVPFTVPERVNDALTLSLGVSTPQFPAFAASVNLDFGKDIAYYEPSRAGALGFNGTVTVRPTEQLRVEARYAYARLNRDRDGTRLSTAHIPRLKLEYQVSRPFFIRVVGQYTSQEQDALRDPTTDAPILIYDAGSGTYEPSTATSANDFRVDVLLSFRPTPGTVLFLGYGSSLTESAPFKFQDLERVTDGFFAKVSYLFRM
jgi:hypothetical protein